MILLTLRRDAPEVSGYQHCDLCGSSPPEGPKGHLVDGPAGTATNDRVLCGPCTAALEGLVREFGGEVALVLQPRDAGVANKLGLPAAVQHDQPAPLDARQATHTVRTELEEEAQRLSHSLEGIRTQASRLAALEQTPPK